MKVSTKKIKEERLLDIVEDIFKVLGYKSSKMDEIAKKANCSKSTLYSYFDSKENLMMAITYRAFNSLLNGYYKSLQEMYGSSGYERAKSLFFCYLRFSEDSFFYYQTLLEYMTFIRSVRNEEKKMTIAMKNSLYFKKVKNIHNLPMTMIIEEIKSGQKDGSISNPKNAVEIFITIWSFLIGYTRINSSPKKEGENTFFNVPMEIVKKDLLVFINFYLMNDIQEMTFKNK